jgi:hypothetical protein
MRDLWRTPDAPNDGGIRTHTTTRAAGHQRTIAEQAEQWPTPTSRDFKDSPGMAFTATNPDGSIRHRDDQLARVAHLWDSDSSHHAPPTSPRGEPYLPFDRISLPPSPRAKLNPRFVEWLMGLPCGWTESERAATPSCPWSLRMRSALSRLAC